MAYIGYIVRFINGDPKFDFVAKTAKDEVSIIPEFADNGIILPAPNVLQSLWKVPVVESDLITKNRHLGFIKLTKPLLQNFQLGAGRNNTYVRLDVCCEQCIHQSVVVVESSLVDVLGGAIRKHPRPRYGETIMRHLKLLQYSNILFYFVVTVARYVPIIIIEHSERSVSKLVPDAEAFSICSPSPFNLETVDLK